MTRSLFSLFIHFQRSPENVYFCLTVTFSQRLVTLITPVYRSKYLSAQLKTEFAHSAGRDNYLFLLHCLSVSGFAERPSPCCVHSSISLNTCSGLHALHLELAWSRQIQRSLRFPWHWRKPQSSVCPQRESEHWCSVLLIYFSKKRLNTKCIKTSVNFQPWVYMYDLYKPF